MRDQNPRRRRVPGGVRRQVSGSGVRTSRVREADARFTRSSGNVFLDLGFPPGEAEHLLLRAELMTAITRLIKERGLTQARAARLFGVTQPRVSDLVRGRTELFSIDSLVQMLGRAGVGVSVRLEPRPRRA